MVVNRTRCLCALLAMVACGGALAQPEAVNRPAAARRMVSQFDFEPSPSEIFELPRYWDLAQDGTRWGGKRPGFPAWNAAAFDASQAYSGTRSVRLTTRGGST